jgi:hypothetical protein
MHQEVKADSAAWRSEAGQLRTAADRLVQEALKHSLEAAQKQRPARALDLRPARSEQNSFRKILSFVISKALISLTVKYCEPVKEVFASCPVSLVDVLSQLSVRFLGFA